MRKISKKAEAGIGTLILFIALILVAAVAAGVLLQTSSSLQSKALATGSKSQTQISTQILVMRVWAENGSTGSLNYIYADVKLGAGSDPINVNTSLVDFFLPDGSASLNYNGTVPQCNQTIVDDLAITRPNLFAVQYLGTSSTHIDGVAQQGEILRLCFSPPRPLQEKEGFRFSYLAKTGTLTQVKATTPDVITEARVNLFPN